MTNGRFLGIDYGAKRIGLAISDENKMLAFPKEIIANDRNIFIELSRLIKDEDITVIVVGESTDFKGKPNAIEKLVEPFVRELEEKFSLPVHRVKEFLTSVEARKENEGNKSFSGRVDASAAALILQRYLDRRS